MKSLEQKIGDQLPNICPVCHFHINPDGVKHVAEGHTYLKIYAAFVCPRMGCRHMFIGLYEQDEWGEPYYLTELMPRMPEKVSLPEEIEALSPSFRRIYSQAIAAEANNLGEVAGVGFRKALEFLIKDFCTRGIEDEDPRKDDIRGKFLGRVINEHVDSPKIKIAAERAAWLGNDETHYVREWEGKDIKDLKQLIKLTLHWIEYELLSENLEEDMPSRKDRKRE